MRVLAAFLLVMTLATSGHPLTARQNPPVFRAEEEQLSPEEEQEARTLVARFEERLLASNDFGQIAGELFVEDFSERLRRAPVNTIPWYFLDKSLIAYADPAALRRHYIAWMNYYGLVLRIYEVSKALKQQSEGNDDDAKIKEVITPEVFNLLLSDPTLAVFAHAMGGDEEYERAKGDESSQPAAATAEADPDGTTEADEAGVIRNVWQLNDVSSTLEKANELLRKHLAAMPSPPSGVDEKKSRQKQQEIYLTSLDEDEYGYPTDTPVIQANTLGFCLQLIKRDGRLKILSVVLYVD